MSAWTVEVYLNLAKVGAGTLGNLQRRVSCASEVVYCTGSTASKSARTSRVALRAFHYR